MSELGTYLFYLDIVKAMFKFLHRLENLDESSLLHDALECSKAIDGCNYSLYIAQSVTCLATDAYLIADPGVASSIPVRSHTFVEIYHEMISTVILLPSAD